MPITPSRWTKDEIYQTEAALYTIIFFLWDYNKRKKPADFEDMLWIIARANKEMFEKYTLDCINVEIFNMFDFEEDLVPMNFRPKNLTEKSWLDYMSEAQMEEIVNAYRKWKSYGKWCVRLKKFKERIKK